MFKSTLAVAALAASQLHGVQPLEGRPLANYYRKMVRDPHKVRGGTTKQKRDQHVTAKTLKVVPCFRYPEDSLDAQVARLQKLKDRRDARDQNRSA